MSGDISENTLGVAEKDLVLNVALNHSLAVVDVDTTLSIQVINFHSISEVRIEICAGSMFHSEGVDVGIQHQERLWLIQ